MAQLVPFLASIGEFKTILKKLNHLENLMRRDSLEEWIVRSIFDLHKTVENMLDPDTPPRNFNPIKSEIQLAMERLYTSILQLALRAEANNGVTADAFKKLVRLRNGTRRVADDLMTTSVRKPVSIGGLQVNLDNLDPSEHKMYERLTGKPRKPAKPIPSVDLLFVAFGDFLKVWEGLQVRGDNSINLDEASSLKQLYFQVMHALGFEPDESSEWAFLDQRLQCITAAVLSPLASQLIKLILHENESPETSVERYDQLSAISDLTKKLFERVRGSYNPTSLSITYPKDIAGLLFSKDDDLDKFGKLLLNREKAEEVNEGLNSSLDDRFQNPPNSSGAGKHADAADINSCGDNQGSSGSIEHTVGGSIASGSSSLLSVSAIHQVATTNLQPAMQSGEGGIQPWPKDVPLANGEPHQGHGAGATVSGTQRMGMAGSNQTIQLTTEMREGQLQAIEAASAQPVRILFPNGSFEFERKEIMDNSTMIKEILEDGQAVYLVNHSHQGPGELNYGTALNFDSLIHHFWPTNRNKDALAMLGIPNDDIKAEISRWKAWINNPQKELKITRRQEKDNALAIGKFLGFQLSYMEKVGRNGPEI